MRTSGLLAVFLVAGFALTPNAADVTWRNSGTDWLTAANWDPDGVPGAGDSALLPYVTPAFQPTLDGAASLLSLEIKNTYNTAWAVGGTGTLSLGAGGLALTGSRNLQRIDANVELTASQTWYFDSRENRNYSFRLGGRLSGTGDLTLEERRGDALCTWYFGDGTTRAPGDFAFDGDTTILHRFCEVQLDVGPQAASADFAFGGTPIAPGTLRLEDGARFRFAASAAAPGVSLGIANPVEIGPGGGTVALMASGATPPQLQLSGDVVLGGPLALLRANVTPAPTYTGTWSLPQDRGATAGLLLAEPGFDLPAYTVGAALADSAGAFANPFLVQSFHQSLTLAAPAAANTYAHGTVVDFCGTPYKTETQVARVVVDAASRLGTGGLTVLPGGKISLPAAACLEAGQPVELRGSGVAAAVVEAGYDGLPALTSSSDGVVALGATYSGAIDQSALGNGTCFLGTVAGGTFAGTSLAPCQDGTWRLGAGGGTMATLTIAQPVLVGDADLRVGRSGWHGNGTVLLAGANTFTGDIDVTGITYFNRDPGAYGASLIGSQLGARSLSAGNALGDPAGTVRLHNSRLLFQQAANANASVRKETLQFEGRSRLHLDFNNYVGQMLFGNIERANRGTLTLYDQRSSFAVRERLVVDSPPAEANGIVPGWFVHERGPHFVTHDATVGYRDFAGYATDINAAGANAVVNTGAAVLTADRACHGLRNTGALTGGYTLSVGAGGILMGEAIATAIDFGTNEGLVYAFTTKQLSGAISGNNGLTVSGTRFDSRAAHSFTGPLTVNGGAYWARFDDDGAAYSFGAADNAILLNGGALVRVAGDRILASRTVTLGEGGGMISGEVTVLAKVTGTGMLIIGNGGSSAGGGNVTVGNPDNDYAGGTFLLSAGGDRTSGRLTATSTGKLGTGDLVVNAYLLATLQGNANLDAGATAHAAMAGRIRFEGPTPLVGGLAGGGDIELGTTASATDLRVGGANRSSVFHGRITQRAAAYPGALTKVGDGRFTLYGAHAFGDATAVQVGELALHGSLAGDLSVGADGALVVYVDADGTARRGHVAGDVDVDGTLVLDGPGAETLPVGTTLTVLTCDGTITADLASVPTGYKVGTSDGVLTLTSVPTGTLILVR